MDRLKGGFGVELYNFVNFNFVDFKQVQERGIDFIGTQKLAMFDWDIPDIGHKTDKCITIAERKDALRICERFTFHRPEYTFILEETPGGVRGWLNKPISVKDYVSISREVHCDPLYTRMVNNSKVWWCRVGPKPNRENDYVSRLWTVVGKAEVPLETKVLYVNYRDIVATHVK